MLYSYISAMVCVHVCVVHLYLLWYTCFMYVHLNQCDGLLCYSPASRNGNTALHEAVLNGYRDCVELLLR